MDAEAGLVTGRAMSEEAKRSGLANVESRSERARADSSKTLGWTDVETGVGEEWVSGVADRTDGIFGKASRWRQEACGNIGLKSGG